MASVSSQINGQMKSELETKLEQKNMQMQRMQSDLDETRK
jgi:hypothetical protein